MQPIALSGEPAPDRLGQLDNQQFDLFFGASVNESGQVGILATVDDERKKFGGWVYVDGDLLWNHQQRDRSPIGRNYDGGALPIPFQQGVALTGPFPNSQQASLVGPAQAMRPLLTPNRTMPGVGQRLLTSEIFVSDNGQVGLRGLTDNGIEALWLVDHTVEELTVDHLVAKSGDPAPEIHPSATFDRLGMQEINGLGEAVALVGYSVTDPEPDSGSSIWAFSAESRRLLAKPNDPAPGTDTTYREFGLVVNNEIGTSAFAARTQSGQGLWLNALGEDELMPLAVTGQAIPGLDLKIDVIPPFSNININDRNEVGFSMRLEGDRVGSSWIGSLNDGLTPIALRGDPVPGMTTWLYEQPSAPALNNKGLAVFEAGILPMGGEFRDLETVLMVRQPDGETKPLLRTGSRFEVSPGDIRTVEEFDVNLFYDRGALNDADQLAAALRFENDTSGVFLFDLSSPGSGGGDPDPGEGAPEGVESIWSKSQGGQWNAAENWSMGVPNGIGQIAAFDNNPVDKVTVSLPSDQDVTLGSLHYRSPVDGVQLRGEKSLRLQAPADDVPRIRTGPAAGRLDLQVNLHGTQDWTADVQSASVLEVSGQLSGGSITKRGDGELRLGGDNKDWTGEVLLEEGTLFASHPNAFGTATVPTKIPEGRLVQIVVQTNGADDEGILEPFLLDGGRLESLSDLHGPLTLLSDSELVVDELHADVRGPGRLTWLGRGTIHEATTYTGETTVHGYLIAAHPQALGSPLAATVIESGGVVSANADLTEPILVREGGTLILANETTYSGPVTVAGGTLAVERTVTTMTSPLAIEGQGILAGQFTLGKGISGSGAAVFEAGSITVQGAIGDDLKLFVRPTAQLTIDTLLSSEAEIDLFGKLTLKQDSKLSRVNLAEGFELTTEGAAILSVDDLPVAGGKYDLNLRTTNPIRIDRSPASSAIRTQPIEFERLGGYDNTIFVDEGRLHVVGEFGLGTASSPTVVASEDAELILMGDQLRSRPVAEEIRLDNAVGYGGSGGLHLYSGAVLSGDVHLGDSGSIINSEQGTISGKLHGGLLTVTRGQLALTSGGHSYSGATELRGGRLALRDSAELTATSRIELHTRIPGQGNESTLSLINQEQQRDDRIADTIPIVSRGGRIEMSGGGGEAQAVTERLGRLELAAGHTDIVVESRGNLAIGELARDPRTTLGVRGVNSENHLLIDAVELNNGIFPGWLTVNDSDFAGYDQVRGVVPYTDYADLATATQASNVLVTSATATISDSTVNSVKFQNEGRLTISGTLTVDAGGVLVDAVTEIRGGRLTAGSAADYDLYFHGRGAFVDAQIVDNAANPVGVVVDSFAVRLAGENNYTGGTRVLNSGELYVTTTTALPLGGAVDVDGGDLIFDSPERGDVRIGQLTVRRGGRLLDQSGTLGVIADEIQAEAGDIRVPLRGNGTFTKVGPDFVEVADATRFRGAFTVREGGLRVLALSRVSDVVVSAGGSFAAGDNLVGIRLEGGGLSGGRFQGTIDVASDSFIRPFQSADASVRIQGRLIGSGDLEVENTELRLEGNNSGYEGQFRLKNANLLPFSRTALGPQGAVMGPGSSIILSPTPLAGPVTLDGGSLIENSRSGESVELAGSLRVRSSGTVSAHQSRRGSRIKLSEVILEPGSHLELNSPPSGSVDDPFGQIEITGPIHVMGSEAGQETALTIDAMTMISGTIVATSDSSSLALMGDFVEAAIESASFAAPTADSVLKIVDASQEAIRLGVSGGLVSGTGVIQNDVVLHSNSRLAPGNGGVGSLNVDGSVAFQTDSLFELEIQNLVGNVGEGWDVLHVAETLLFDDATLKIQSIDGNGESGPAEGFDSRGQFSLTIATGSDVSGVDSLALDASGFLRRNTVSPFYGFALQSSADQLELTYGFNGDANNDGQVNAADVDLFCTTTEVAFDLDGNGSIGLDDVALYLDQVHATKPGDVDLNGSVDFVDFLTLSANFDAEGGWAHGDFDCSGEVAFADFLTLSVNFGFQAGGTSPVPEPGSLGLLYLALALYVVLDESRLAASHVSCRPPLARCAPH